MFRSMDSVLKINPGYVRSQLIYQAAKVIKNGGIIIYPTDTIYGLGCDAVNRNAVDRIFEIKHRNPKNPALVLVHNISMLRELIEDISPKTKILMKRFWPGPLTMLFKARKGIHPLLVSNNGKIGIRIPKNNYCLKLMKICRTPIVSTSANISGEKQPTEISDLIKMFSQKVDLIIDAGDNTSLLPSTVIDASEDKPILIREGAVRFREIISSIQSSRKH